MEKNYKYYVIGGRPGYPIYYGGRDTLFGAERLATAREEFWEDVLELHKPKIYAVNDASTYPVASWNGSRWVYEDCECY